MLNMRWELRLVTRGDRVGPFRRTFLIGATRNSELGCLPILSHAAIFHHKQK